MKSRFILIMALAAVSSVVRAEVVAFVGSNNNPSAPVGGLLDAANWEGGEVPSGSSTGLVTATAHVWVGTMQNLAVRQTGGLVGNTASVAMRGGTAGSGISTVYEIEDVRTDYAAYTNLMVNGTLTFWSQFGEPIELSLLSGHVEVGTLTLSARDKGTINLRDGIFHAARMDKAMGTVNMLAGGTGEFVVDVLDAELDKNFSLNFETGNEGRFLLGGKSGGVSAAGTWQWLILNGQVSIDGEVDANHAHYVISEDGLGSAISLGSGTDAGAFTFVQLCDTQMGFGGYEHDLKTFKQAVHQINELKPDFVVICGDLVNRPHDQSFADFKEIKSELTMPCYCAAGNHDVGNTPTAARLKRYRTWMGKDYYAFEHKGYTFVIANTQLWKSPLDGESEAHNDWVVQTVQAAKAKGSPVFIVQHYPLYINNPDEEEEYYNLPVDKRKELLALYGQCNVVAVLAGHTHKTLINQYGDIQLVTGGTTSKNLDQKPLGFRRWVVSESTAEHEFIPLQSVGLEGVHSYAEDSLKVYFVRHAEAGHNVVHKWKNKPKDQWPSYVGNSGMFTPTGEEQIAVLTEKLKGMQFDFIAASPVWRAHNTIFPYLMATGQKCEIWPELAETEPVPIEWTVNPDVLPQPSPDLFYAKRAIHLSAAELLFFTFIEKNKNFLDPNREDNAQTMANNLALAQKTADRIKAQLGNSGKSILLAGHGNSGYTLLRTLTSLQDIRTVLENTGIWMAEEQPDGSFTLKILNNKPYEN